MSAMPPGSCFRSKPPGFASDSSPRIRRRIFAHLALELRAVDVRDEDLAPQRLECARRRAAIPRALGYGASAWCSQTQASCV